MINVSILNPNIVCKNTVDGLEISWDDLSSVQGFKKYHLLRKRYDYSTLATDGDIVYSGTDNSIKDIDIENGVSYYYTLWLVVTRTFGEELVDDYLTNNRFRKNIIVHKLGDSADKMYNSLPGVYLREDKKLPSEIPLPLYRYMQLIGYQFDKVENLVNLILDNIDIDVCDERFLPVIAKWLGVTYDWSLSVTDNRILIKLMIENYSRKGTYDGLLTLVQKISKSRVEILVDKTPVLNTASYEEIKQRRTVIVDIYIGDE
jgi:phage tail-like protein